MPRTPTISDTPPDIRARVVEGWRSMSVIERAELTDQLCRDVVELAVAGVRLQYPHLDDDEVLYEVTRRRLGRALADAAYQRPAG